MIRNIAGRQNASVKLARKLQKKKYRVERSLFPAEGFDLLAVGIGQGWVPREVLVREGLEEQLSALLGPLVSRVEVGVCSREVLAECSSLGGAADVITLFPLPSAALADVDLGRSLTVYLHQVGDPGNVGTLIRSSAAFGAQGVLLGPQTADAYGPKALRAGMGAHFLLHIVPEVAAEDVRRKLEADNRRGTSTPRLIIADAREGDDPRKLVSGGGKAGVLLVLGSERGALPDMGADVSRARIEQTGFDSLNVAMAGTILLYELSRSRSGLPSGRQEADGRRAKQQR